MRSCGAADCCPKIRNRREEGVIFFGINHVPTVKGEALDNPFATHLARAIAMNLAVHDKCAGSALEEHDDVSKESDGYFQGGQDIGLVACGGDWDYVKSLVKSKITSKFRIQKVAPEGSLNDAASAISKKVSFYKGIQYGVLFWKSFTLPKK